MELVATFEGARYRLELTARRVSDAFIWPDVLGSDHCPVGVDVD